MHEPVTMAMKGMFLKKTPKKEPESNRRRFETNFLPTSSLNQLI